MNKLKELIDVVQLRKNLEDNIAKAKAVFEESIVSQKEALVEIQDQELILREETLLQMEQDNKDSEIEGNFTINKAVKKTKQIIDPDQFHYHLISNPDFYEKLGIDNVKIADTAFKDTMVVTDKKALEDIISKVENFNGTLPDGVQIKETKYITITENKAT